MMTPELVTHVNEGRTFALQCQHKAGGPWQDVTERDEAVDYILDDRKGVQRMLRGDEVRVQVPLGGVLVFRLRTLEPTP